MNIKRNTMIFYRDWLEKILRLDDRDMLTALTAILEYGFTGKRPEFAELMPDVRDLLDAADERIQKDYQRFVDYIEKMPWYKKDDKY